MSTEPTGLPLSGEVNKGAEASSGQVTATPLWREMDEAYTKALLATLNPFTEDCDRFCYAAILRLLAGRLESRGALGVDLDPSESADWLRAEAALAEQVERPGTT